MFNSLPLVKRRLAIYSYLTQKRIKNKMKKGLSHKPEIIVMKSLDDDDIDSHIVDDMPLTINRDPYPGSGYHQESAT